MKKILVICVVVISGLLFTATAQAITLGDYRIVDEATTHQLYWTQFDASLYSDAEIVSRFGGATWALMPQDRSSVFDLSDTVGAPDPNFNNQSLSGIVKWFLVYDDMENNYSGDEGLWAPVLFTSVQGPINVKWEWKLEGIPVQTDYDTWDSGNYWSYAFWSILANENIAVGNWEADVYLWDAVSGENNWQLVLENDFTIVPEPATLLLLGSGLAGLGLFRKKFRKK